MLALKWKCQPNILALIGAAAGKNSKTVKLILILKFHYRTAVLLATFVLFCLSGMRKKAVLERKWGFFIKESIAFPSEKPTIQPF